MMGGSPHLLRLALGRGLFQPTDKAMSPSYFHIYPFERDHQTGHLSQLARRDTVLLEILRYRGRGESIKDYDLIVRYGDQHDAMAPHRHEHLYSESSSTPLAHRQALWDDGRLARFVIRKKDPERPYPYDEGNIRCLPLTRNEPAVPKEDELTMRDIGFPEHDTHPVLQFPLRKGFSPLPVNDAVQHFVEPNPLDLNGFGHAFCDDRGNPVTREVFLGAQRAETDQSRVNAMNNVLDVATNRLPGGLGSGTVPVAPRTRTVPQGVPQAALHPPQLQSDSAIPEVDPEVRRRGGVVRQ